VSGLKRSTAVVSHREGGDPAVSRKSPGETQYEAITLERGLTQDPGFEEWAKQVSNLSAGGASTANFRKDVRIELLNEAGQIVLAYQVYRCWVSEYQALSDLDAGETPWRSSRFVSRTRAGSVTPVLLPQSPERALGKAPGRPVLGGIRSNLDRAPADHE